MPRLPIPDDLLACGRRVLFFFAHQDDELPYGGLIQRAPAGSRFLWLTNGDGIADELKMEPAEYAAARQLETMAALRTVGVERDRLTLLGHSEKVIYRQFLAVASRPHEALPFFLRLSAQVTAEFQAARPDVVFTLAWQGGHPEHDLVHLLARAACATLPGTRLFELPEYELANLVPLRFPPWHLGPVYELKLTPEEMAGKQRMRNCYPTQARILRQFTCLIRTVGLLGIVTAGRPLGIKEYLGVETFGPVPEKREYTASPHGLDSLDYVGDDCDGVPISYVRMIAPIARALVENA